MNQPSRHELDAAIDRVAERMVAVPEDSGLLARTMTQLPERQATPWFLGMRVQLVAAAAIVLVAFIYARPSRQVTSNVVPQVAVTAPTVARTPDPSFAKATEGRPGSRIPVAAPPVARRLPTPASRLPVERRPEDHERSLAPVDAIDALELIGIAPSAIEIETAAALDPLVLPELALDSKGDR